MTSPRQNHAATAQTAADALDALPQSGAGEAFIGFDGFIDSIIDVVDTRSTMHTDDYKRIATINDFAKRVAAAAGKSANMELIVREKRWGGNGPLLAGALASLGMDVTFVGAVGSEQNHVKINPAYTSFAQACTRVLSIAVAGRTDAFEFDDGKIMFNHTASIQAVTWRRLTNTLSPDNLVRILRPVRLIGLTNWSLMGSAGEIWQGLIDEVFPKLEPLRRATRRIFIDLSDPAKRTDDDLKTALDQLKQLDAHAPLIFGMNLAESQRISMLLGCKAHSRDLENAATNLVEAIGIDCVVIHQRTEAAAATRSGIQASFNAPFTNSPKLLTGAGDHFNAGFAFAYSHDLSLDQCLATACAVGGSFVREAQTPSREALVAFLRDLPEPQQA